MKKSLTAVTGRSAAALLREAAKRNRGDALKILAGLEDTKVRTELAIQMIWDGPGFDRTG